MRHRVFACAVAACICACPPLCAQTPEQSVPAWSIGAGYGQVAFPVAAGVSLTMGSGVVSLEPRIAPALALHAELGGSHATEWIDAPEARTWRFARLGLGARYFFVPNGSVRPSVLLQAIGHTARFSDERGVEGGLDEAGGELSLGADASISESVHLRLETAVATLARSRIWQDTSPDFHAWNLRFGISPRAELRIGW